MEACQIRRGVVSWRCDEVALGGSDRSPRSQSGEGTKEVGVAATRWQRWRW
ncbi:proline-rich receptor-like protein kinase PERK9 [Iris pallida]|uniref:Proline-rich receptor-like protein kinase PERK9 n=1 Tax=Iris pallida TaxID=29817 RepID=A0AAX6GTU0_IRIPA|nr:proline-rich receptor-like protein kinase PERK9 [Iris pallida]